MKTKRIILVALFCGCLALTGCKSSEAAKDNNITESEYVEEMISADVKLNDRQIDICKKEGLHTVYSQLTDLQKEAIIKSDLLLTYLEDKYDKEFKYENFVLRPDTSFVVARASDDSYRRDITASMNWVNDEYVYSDTYEMQVIFSDEYKELLTEYISSIKPDAVFAVDVDLNTVTDEVAARENVMENTDGSISILFEDSFANDEEMVAFLREIAEWIVSHNKNNAAIDLRVFPKEALENEEVNVVNYLETYVVDEYMIRLYDCIIENQGEIRIEGPY